MTVNDQHAAICEMLLSRAQMLHTTLESMLQILKDYPPVKRDRNARQTTFMMNEVVRLVSGAEVTAALLERTLRYSRIGNDAVDDEND